MSKLSNQPVIIDRETQKRLMQSMQSAAAQISTPFLRLNLGGAGLMQQREEYEGFDADELISLGLLLLRSEDFVRYYEILAQSPMDGKSNYYDRLIVPQHVRSYRVLTSALKRFELNPVEQGLDVGCGTGESSIILASMCRSITALDIVGPMLNVAEKKLSQLKNTNQINGFQAFQRDINSAQIAPDSFDIVIDNLLYPYLSPQELAEYWELVRFILKKGGRYYSYLLMDYREPGVNKSAKSRLVSVINQTLFRQSLLSEHFQKQPNINPHDHGFQGDTFILREENFTDLLIRWVKPS